MVKNLFRKKKYFVLWMCVSVSSFRVRIPEFTLFFFFVEVKFLLLSFEGGISSISVNRWDAILNSLVGRKEKACSQKMMINVRIKRLSMTRKENNLMIQTCETKG